MRLVYCGVVLVAGAWAQAISLPTGSGGSSTTTAAAVVAPPTLPTEPGPGEPGTIMCRVRLPNGKSCTRRFYTSDPMAQLLLFAESQPDVSTMCAGKSIQLTVRQPTRVFTRELLCDGQSFEALGVSVAQETFLLSAV